MRSSFAPRLFAFFFAFLASTPVIARAQSSAGDTSCALAAPATAPASELDYPHLRYGFHGGLGFGAARSNGNGMAMTVAGRLGSQLRPQMALYWELSTLGVLANNGVGVTMDNHAVFEHTWGHFLLAGGAGISLGTFAFSPSTATTFEDPLARLSLLARVGWLLGPPGDGRWYVALEARTGTTQSLSLTLGWDHR